MMKSVTEYKNYREYVLDYYQERKRCSAFTWREFAKDAGFASGSYLKLVSDGKTSLREESAKKICPDGALRKCENRSGEEKVL